MICQKFIVYDDKENKLTQKIVPSCLPLLLKWVTCFLLLATEVIDQTLLETKN